MHNKTFKTSSKQGGFSLIELVVVVLIIGILASVATPIYRDYVQRGYRADAMETLTDMMAQQQRFVLRQRTFTTTLTLLGYGSNTVETDNGYYNVTASAGCGNINRCVLLTATPIAGKSQDGDGIITLSSRGEKQWNGQDGWNHK